jgi:hypothetical protein
MHIFIYSHIHIFIHTYLRSYLLTYIRVHTYNPTYIIHTYVRTYISVLTLIGINFLGEKIVVISHYHSKSGWKEVLHKISQNSSAVALPLTKISIRPIPFEVDPLALIQRLHLDFHDRKHFYKTFHVSVLITFCDTVLIYIMLSKRRPLKLNFIFGNRKRSQRARSGEEGKWVMTAIFVDTKIYCTTSDTWTGTLSLCWAQELLHHFCGSLCWIFWLQSPQNFATEYYTHCLS